MRRWTAWAAAGLAVAAMVAAVAWAVRSLSGGEAGPGARRSPQQPAHHRPTASPHEITSGIPMPKGGH